MFDLEQAMYAADLAALRASVRSVFASGQDGVDGITTLVVRVTVDSPSLLVIEGEFSNAAGEVVGGFGV